MSVTLYYTPPSDEIFEDIKQTSKRIWSTYSDEYGYRTEKLNRIMTLPNVRDNYIYMVAMFDWENKIKLLDSVKPATYKRIMEALAS